jgi:two-component system NtrC family sensor kinase
MATAFNRMTDIIQRNKEMESTLAQQGKMASLGILSSGVAHEINNPLGVILGYSAYLEGKLAQDDPNRLLKHRVQFEMIDKLRRIYSVAEHMAISVLPRSVLAGELNG